MTDAEITRLAADDRIQACRTEQLRAAQYVGTEHPEAYLALIGMCDWFAEEYLLTHGEAQ